ncbi:MAG: prepilin-type N-terminal cleavage/methylation domain-containing protein [Gemmatimonadaceae bacterium]
MKSSPTRGLARLASRHAERVDVRRRPVGRARRGFTVLEALIALTIIGFAVVATVEALGGGLRAEAQVSRQLEAVTLAESRMNELGALPRDSLLQYVRRRDGVFAPPFERYRWRTAIEPVAGTRTLLRATVTVAWDGRTYALETVFYHGGVGSETSPAPAAGQ